MKKLIQKKNKKILVFISNGSGEVEFIYPYLYLIKKNALDIKFLYLDKKVFDKACNDLLWSKLITLSNYKTTFLKNKYYDKYNFLNLIGKTLQNLASCAKLLWQITFIDILIIDYGQIRTRFCNIAKLYALMLNKNIYAMPHTSNADYLFNMNEVPSPTIKKKFGYSSPRNKEVALTLDSYSFSYNYYFLNFKKQFFVGNPRRNKKFLDFVSSINHGFSDYILFCSFYSKEKLFSLLSKENHFINMYLTVRKYYPYSKIIITLHPRENPNEIRNFISKYNCKNIQISEINTMILSKNANLTIGTVTSAMYCPLYFGQNSIHYWEDDEKYFSYVGHSHPLNYLGIMHAKNILDLERLIQKHLNGENFFISDFFNPNHNNIKNIFNLSDGDI